MIQYFLDTLAPGAGGQRPHTPPVRPAPGRK